MTFGAANPAAARRRTKASTETPERLPTIQFGKVSLFRGLTGSEINVVKATATERKFLASEIIVRFKERAIRLFLVERGCVNYSALTSDGREILLVRFVPGDVFGLSAFLSGPSCYLGTAKAVHDTKVLAWDYRLIRQLASAYPRLAENALTIALHSIALHAERHIGLVSKSAGRGSRVS